MSSHEKIASGVVKVVQIVFKTMGLMSIDPKDPYPMSKEKDAFDLTGVIGLTGEYIGALGLRFQRGLASKIASKILQSEIEEHHAEVVDVVAELTNMIAGNLKTDMYGYDVNFDISLPTVIQGPGHTYSVPGNIPGIVVPFSSNGDQFIVEVCLKKK